MNLRAIARRLQRCPNPYLQRRWNGRAACREEHCWGVRVRAPRTIDGYRDLHDEYAWPIALNPDGTITWWVCDKSNYRNYFARSLRELIQANPQIRLERGGYVGKELGACDVWSPEEIEALRVAREAQMKAFQERMLVWEYWG